MFATKFRALLATLVVLGACSLAPAGVRAAMVTVDFDVDPFGLPIAAPKTFNQTVNLTDLFSPLGVTFGTDGGPFDGGSILDVGANFGVGARSGSNFLAFNQDGFNGKGGRTRGPEILLFDSLVADVSIFAATGWGVGVFTMDGYRGGSLVASEEQSSPAGSYVELSISDAVGFDKVVLGQTGRAFSYVYDDLSFGYLEVAGGTGTGILHPDTAVPAPTTLLLTLPAVLGLIGGPLAGRRRG